MIAPTPESTEVRRDEDGALLPRLRVLAGYRPRGARGPDDTREGGET